MAARVRREPPASLTDESLARGLRTLARRDRELARVFAQFGPPPTWFREPGFATLVLTILEQQVSLASAAAAFARLEAAASPLTPHAFLALGDPTLKAAGFSRQKLAYSRGLAEAIAGGSLDLEALAELPDEVAKAELLKVRGIGSWTADIYLLRSLRRPDAWPSGDLALAVSLAELKGLPARPTPLQLEALAEPWRPWRSVAARLLWNHYLNRKKSRQ
jgi:DNA-3-methyladenine glycosylase II